MKWLNEANNLNFLFQPVALFDREVGAPNTQPIRADKDTCSLVRRAARTHSANLLYLNNYYSHIFSFCILIISRTSKKVLYNNY